MHLYILYNSFLICVMNDGPKPSQEPHPGSPWQENTTSSTANDADQQQMLQHYEKTNKTHFIKVSSPEAGSGTIRLSVLATTYDNVQPAPPPPHGAPPLCSPPPPGSLTEVAIFNIIPRGR